MSGIKSKSFAQSVFLMSERVLELVQKEPTSDEKAAELIRLEQAECAAVGSELSSIERSIVKCDKIDVAVELKGRLARLKFRVLEEDWDAYSIERRKTTNPLYARWSVYEQRMGDLTTALYQLSDKLEWGYD